MSSSLRNKYTQEIEKINHKNLHAFYTISLTIYWIVKLHKLI